MLKEKLFKLLSFISSGSLLLNTFIAPISVLAQDAPAEPSPAVTSIVQTTPEPTTTVDNTSLDSEVSVDITPALTPEVTPTEEVTPTVTEEVAPQPTLEATETPEATAEPTITAGEDETATDENQEQIAATVVDNQTIFESDASDELKSSTTDGSTSLQTDKADYIPGEVVIITGSGFDANTIYSIDISSTGNYKFSDRVTSDESGGLFYTYKLDDTFRPQYTVEIKDVSGSVISSTTFTDTNPQSGCIIDTAGANDEPGQKDLTKMCADYSGLPNFINVSWDWDETSWSGNNTGDGCSLYDTDGDGKANYSLCVTVENSPATYKSKTLYSCGNDSAYKCTQPLTEITQISGTTCDASVQATDPFEDGDAYPNDTVANCTVGMIDVGGIGAASLIDVCSYPSREPNSDPSDCIIYSPKTALVEVIKNLIPLTDTGLFNLLIDGSVKASDVSDGGSTGKITVDTNNNGTTVEVSETAGTSTDLNSYSTYIECKDNNGTGNVVASSSSTSVNVQLNSEDDVVCLITNTLNTATLTLEKTVTNDNGGTATVGDFQAYIDGGVVSWDTPETVNAGSHTASESTLTGYQASIWGGDCAADGTVTLNPGDDKTCTITNDDIAPKLTLVKTVINDNGGTKQISDFHLYIDGTPATSGVAYNETANVEITVTEDQLSGYTASVWGGDCSSDGKVTLLPGDNKTCTITNNDEAATLIVKKVVNNNYGGTLEADDFTFSVNSNSPIYFEADGQNDLTVNAGTYSVTEPAVSGYSTTYDNCTNMEIANGESATCTITNSDIQPILHVIKVVDLSYGGTAVPSDFSFSVTGNNASPSTFSGAGSPGVLVTLDAGGYDVDETYSPPGYVANESADCKGTINIGEEKTCTFTNSDSPATLTVIKHVINDDGGTAVASDFTMNVTGTNLSQSSFPGSEAGVSVNLNAGSYSVDEDGFAGYGKTLSADCSGTITVGETKTCTVTNNDIPGSISGYKYADDGQTGLESWTINLYDCTGIDDFVIAQCIPAGSAVTDSNGFYKFENLSAGKYIVMEVEKYGWTILSPSNNQNNVFVTLGQESTDNNFINFDNGYISGHKWNDLNGNGVWDVGEPAVAGWTIKLDRPEGGDLTRTTEANGYYIFSNLGPGSYIVYEMGQAGWIQTAPGGDGKYYVDMVSDGSFPDRDFGNFELGKINACKYEDLTGNGVLDEGIDEPMEGISMILTKTDDSNWTPIVQETATSCCTTFEGLMPGHYRVDEDKTDPDLNGFYSSNSIYSYEFDVTSGSEQTANFLDARYREISGFKYEDLNNNGTRDAGEPGLQDWTIFIDYDNNGQLDGGEPFTVTDVNGYYVFSNLVADTYIVREVLKDGWVQTEPVSGSYEIDGHIIVYSPDNNFGNFHPQPSLSTIKSNTGPDEILVGETATFQVVVENTGNVPLYNLVITDTFDTDYVDFTSSTPINPASIQEDMGVDTGDYDNDGDTSEHIGLITWDVASLDPGQSITLTLYFLATAATPDPVVATNGAQTTACAEDAVECSKEDTLITDVSYAHVDIDEISISLTKTNNRTSAISAGDGVNYTLTVKNTGDIDIDSVVVMDVLPGGFEYVDGSTKIDGSATGDPTIDNGVLKFDIGRLDGGAQKVIEYQAQTNADISSGTYTNLAYCKGTAREVATVECSLVQSSVQIGQGEPSANVGGEVLGYVLPATGSQTSLFVLFISMLIIGTLLRLLGFGLDNNWFDSEKIKSFAKKTLQIVLVLGFLFVTKNVKAITNTVSIEDLPEYVTTDSFKLSYSALSDSSVIARFYVRKDGDGTWRNIDGEISGASGQVQVDPKDIYNGDGRYYFRVEINGDPAFVDETNTLIDRGAPNPVSNYWKEKVAGGFYRLHWTTPDNDDFNRVLIYRSTENHFTANGSTKVAEVGGAKNTEVIWDNVGLDSTKDYYYAVRAVDNAGNASGVVADPETVTVLSASATAEGAGEEVTNLPQEATPTIAEEKGTGENVLGQEAEITPAPVAKNIVQKAAQFAKDRTKITVGILAGLVIIGYFLYTRVYLKRK